MALSGASQSHVQPVWAEIPSRSADIGAQAVPRALSFRDHFSRIVCIINMNLFGRALDNPSALPAQNLLAGPVNSRLPNQYLPEAMDANVRAPR
ncbi:Hypothetical predicted protein [Podarcis lilfordi]|uniref:Uncharacterized protein n=1 Tax=Podarcis lilfordi TaxID=74358 RepID=A0AA35PJP8_9SAUR|nr:Hypothetical predicted protein [Podarcis lilfordi]